MGQSVIKNPRKIWSQSGGDPSLVTRVETLENNENYYYYKADINNTAGTITVPTGATIVLDQFQGGADAFCSTIVNGKPTLVFPVDSGGTPVDVATFDALGAYTLTGTPSAYPVALIYILKIKAKDQANLVEADIVEEYPIEELYQKADINPRISTITSSTTPSINIDSYDELHITALSGNITSMTSGLTGTPADGRVIIYQITDNGTARSITWGASFATTNTPASLPSTTVISKKLYVAFKYNSTTSLWDCMAASIGL